MSWSDTASERSYECSSDRKIQSVSATVGVKSKMGKKDSQKRQKGSDSSEESSAMAWSDTASEISDKSSS